MDLTTRLLATDWGSPHGVTQQAQWARLLWRCSYYFAIPVGLLVIFLILWALIRYRSRPGHDRTPDQFQYHIPIEAVYTLAPLVLVVVIFGIMFHAENKQMTMAKGPGVLKIRVEGFQWGWRFVYPNGHSQVGTADYNSVNDNNNLPVLVMPANRTVEFEVMSLDVVHTFYVPEFLYNRDLIPGIDNRFDVNVTKPGLYYGQCNNICGQYHAYMRFVVDVKSAPDYDKWYAGQPACSVTNAAVGSTPVDGRCTDEVPGLNKTS